MTNEERFNQANERLQNGLNELGIQTGLTNDQFKSMIQSLDTSNETRIKLLELAPALLAVNAALDAQKPALLEVNAALDAQKNKTDEVTNSILELNELNKIKYLKKINF